MSLIKFLFQETLSNLWVYESAFMSHQGRLGNQQDSGTDFMSLYLTQILMSHLYNGEQEAGWLRQSH